MKQQLRYIWMKFVETYDYRDIGYQKLFHHQNWRVAVLNYIDELEIDQIQYVEAHNLTDEAFVLLEGECHLIFAEVHDGKINDISCINMKKHVVYKIPQGIYHTHTLSKDAHILIIEEENTGYENSPRIYLSEEEKKHMMKRFE